MSQNSSSSFSSGQGHKPSYNKHFPRSFLLNYGGAIQDISEEAVLSRLHDFNCEWLQRPNIALSEMAQTLRENFPILASNSPNVQDGDFVESILTHFRPLSNILSRMDNKDKTSSEPASREDVVEFMKVITGQPDLEERLREGLNAAGALFMTCVHLLVPITLMRNPQEFAEKARRTPANQRFKEDPSAKRMRDFILDSVTRRRRPGPGASIWDAPDEEDEVPQAASSRGRARSLPSAWEDDAEEFQPPARPRQVDWTSAAPTRRGKRPAPGPSTSTPVQSGKKRRLPAPPSSASSSSSEDEKEEEARPLALAKAAKTAKKTVSRPAPSKAAAKKKAVSSSSSCSSSSSSDSSGEEAKQEKSKASKSQKQSQAESQKPKDKKGKTPTPANTKDKAKADGKSKQGEKNKQKSSVIMNQHDDVWGDLAAAAKKK